MTIPGTTRQNGVSAQERLSALGYYTAESARTEDEAAQWFRKLHGIADDESGDAEFERILFDDDDAFPAPREGAVIDGEEARHQLDHVKRVLAAADDEEREKCLAEGVLAFGGRFVTVWKEMVSMAPPEQTAQFEAISGEAMMIYAGWLKGRVLTDRPDEAERRALAGHAMLDEVSGPWMLHHYAAKAILELPELHPLRDVKKVRCHIRAVVRRYRLEADSNRTVLAADAVGVALNGRFGTDDELVGWAKWSESFTAQIPPESQISILMEMEGLYLELADEARARGDDAAVQRWLAEATAVGRRTDALPMDAETRAKSHINAARRHVHADLQEKAADEYQAALDCGAFSPRIVRMIAAKLARVRLAYGKVDDIVGLLPPLLAGYEAEYLTAIRRTDRKDAGEQFAEACMTLAFAHAKRGEWPAAIEAIERPKSLRQRHQIALRKTPAAAQLLELEGGLYAISRGVETHGSAAVAQVEDWLAHGLSPEAQFQEEYHRTVPQIDPALLQPMTMEVIAGALRPREAAVSVCLGWPGLLVAVIVPGPAPLALGSVRADFGQKDAGDLLAGDAAGRDGFLIALERGLETTDPRPALDRLLARLDEVLARPVAQALEGRGIERLVLLPHNFLRLAPLWALPSWANYEIRILPGAAALAGTAHAPTVHRRALAVANPTGDLPLAPIESSLARAHLVGAGFAVSELHGDAAHEAAIQAALPGCGILHFAGHGRVSLTDSSESSLLVAPHWETTPVAGPDALIAIARSVGAWDVVDESIGRKAVALANIGRLVQIDGAEDGACEISLEYAREGTLFARIAGDSILECGELWRTGDILVQGTLDEVGLAFLCACSSGQGSIDNVEEASGLPAALQIAGVGCVVSTGWPVADEITVLFAQLFFAGFAAASDPEVNVARLVQDCSAELREMPRAEAVRRVESLAAQAADRATRFHLSGFARSLAKGPDFPFQHPFDSGAFFVTGSPDVRLAPLPSEIP